MKVFDLPPSALVGELKAAIKEAILDGKIENNYQEAFNFMCIYAKKKGLNRQ